MRVRPFRCVTMKKVEAVPRRIPADKLQTCMRQPVIVQNGAQLGTPTRYDTTVTVTAEHPFHLLLLPVYNVHDASLNFRPQNDSDTRTR